MLNNGNKNLATGSLLTVALAFFVLLGVTSSARADSVEFDYNHMFSGTAPAGTSPWLSAVFTDVSTDTVSLTLNGAGLMNSEYVKGWYFNVTGINPASLTFAETSQAGTFNAPTISKATDYYKADGSGKYDILFSFATANGHRFVSGDSITYTITGLGLDAVDFNALCTASAGMGPFYSAAQVCAIPSNGQSGWINPSTSTVTSNSHDGSVPDTATTIFMLGFAALLLECMRRKLPAFRHQ